MRECRAVVAFHASGITYDVAHAQIIASNLDALNSVINTNSTTVQQETTISGQQQVTDTHGWSDTYGVEVTMKTGAKFPLLGELFSIEVKGSASWVHQWVDE